MLPLSRSSWVATTRTTPNCQPQSNLCTNSRARMLHVPTSAMALIYHPSTRVCRWLFSRTSEERALLLFRMFWWTWYQAKDLFCNDKMFSRTLAKLWWRWYQAALTYNSRSRARKYQIPCGKTSAPVWKSWTTKTRISQTTRMFH